MGVLDLHFRDHVQVVVVDADITSESDIVLIGEHFHLASSLGDYRRCLRLRSEVRWSF